MSFLDKARPVASSTPSFVTKAKPTAPTTPSPSTPAKPDLLQQAEKAVTSVFPGKQVGQAIGTLGGLAFTAAKEKLGFAKKGTTALYDTSAPSPLSTLGDTAKGAATIFGLKMPAPIGSTALNTVARATASGATLGALGGAGQKATETDDLAEIAKGGMRGALYGGAISGGITGTGQILSRAGDNILNSIIKPSQADIDDGFAIDTVKKYNLGGPLRSTFNKTETLMDDLSKQLNAKLAASNERINLADTLKRTMTKLSGNKLSSFGSNKQMAAALQNLQDEVAGISDDGLLAITDAQTVKRAAGHFGAWTHGIPDPEATARAKVYNVFYHELKNQIEDASPEGVREINEKLSKLIPVMNAVIRRIPVAERNNVLSLTDVITLASGAINPAGIGAFALNRASKSGNIGTLLSNIDVPLTNAAQPLGVFGAMQANQPEQ